MSLRRFVLAAIHLIAKSNSKRRIDLLRYIASLQYQNEINERKKMEK